MLMPASVRKAGSKLDRMEDNTSAMDTSATPVVWTLTYERLVIGAQIRVSKSPQLAIRDSAAGAEPRELAETSVQRLFNHPTRHGAPELDMGRANAGRQEVTKRKTPWRSAARRPSSKQSKARKLVACKDS